MGLTAKLGEPASVLCAQGAECPTPPAHIETALGSFDAREISEDEFNQYRIGFVALMFIVEMGIALFLTKLLREQEARKTPTIGGV